MPLPRHYTVVRDSHPSPWALYRRACSEEDKVEDGPVQISATKLGLDKRTRYPLTPVALPTVVVA